MTSRRDRGTFVQFVLELMPFVRGLRVRAMFGGYGVYDDDRIFAIIDDDRLFLRSSPDTRIEFEARDLRPFAYTARGKTVTLSYYETPAEVFEDPDAMRHWVGKALRIAMGASEQARFAGPRGARKKRRATNRVARRGR